jgi:hypothetical protein
MYIHIISVYNIYIYIPIYCKIIIEYNRYKTAETADGIHIQSKALFLCLGHFHREIAATHQVLCTYRRH